MVIAFLAVNNASIILMGCNAGDKESHHNQPANDQRDQNTHSQARNERVAALVNSGSRGLNSRHAIHSHRIPPMYCSETSWRWILPGCFPSTDGSTSYNDTNLSILTHTTL
jgi:hypothetical protein